jgi:hypothetical protein
MSQIKLKPCPFCQGEPALIDNGSNSYVKCRMCFAMSDDGSVERAVDAWNTRSLPSADRADGKIRTVEMTEDQIEHMARRFLSWRLPKNFSPDAGISYTRPNYAPEVDATPSGTNLLDYNQARDMVLSMVDGLPHDASSSPLSPDALQVALGAFKKIVAAKISTSGVAQCLLDVRRYAEDALHTLEKSDALNSSPSGVMVDREDAAECISAIEVVAEEWGDHDRWNPIANRLRSAMGGNHG